MKTIPLADHKLSRTDFSNFELEIQMRGAVFSADLETWTVPEGNEYVNFTNAAITFNEEHSRESELERVFQKYGFQRKAP